MILVRHTLRSIKGNGVRSLLILGSIMVSSMVFFSNLVTSEDVTSQYQELQRAIYRDYDLLVTSGFAYFEQSDLTYPTDDVSEAIGITYYIVEGDGEQSGTYFKLMGTDVTAMADGGLVAGDGTLGNEDVIIGTSAASRLGLSSGDIISWVADDGSRELAVTVVAEDEGILRTDTTYPLVIVGSERLREETGLQDGQLSALLLDVRDGVDATATADKIREDNEDFDVTELASSQTLARNLATIRMVLLAILLVVLALNVYIVTSNSRVLLERRLYSLGILRSVGASRAMVAWLLILENLVYGLVGGVLGVVLGLLLRGPLTSVFTGASATSEIGPDVLVAAGLTVAFACGLQALSTVGMVVRQSGRSVRAVLMDKTDAALKVSVVGSVCGALLATLSVALHWLNGSYSIVYSAPACACVIMATVLLLPLLLKLVSRPLSLALGRTAGWPVGLGARNVGYGRAVCSNVTLISVTLMIVLGVFMLSDSLADLIRGASDQFDCDVLVTGLTEEADAYASLSENEQVERVEPVYYTSPDSVELGGVSLPLVVAGLDGEGHGITDDGGRAIAGLGDGQALLDSYYAARLGVSQGDSVTVTSDDFEVGSLDLEIVGFVDSTSFTTARDVLVVSVDEYLKEVGRVPAALYVDATGDVDDAEDAVRRELAQNDVVVQTVEAYLESQESTTEGIVGMVWLILLLSVLLALVGVVNNAVLGFMQRRREYAVLMSTSMSRRQMYAMLLSEVACLIALGCAVAFAVEAWFDVVLSDLLFSIGICVTVGADAATMLLVSGATFVALMLTAVVPVASLRRMPLVDELKRDA